MSVIQTAVLGLVPKVTLATPAQAADYAERCVKLAGCLDQAGDRLRAGLANGRTPPALGVRAAVRQLDTYLASPVADDPLLVPRPPPAMDASRFRQRLAEVVAASVRPALARHRDLGAGRGRGPTAGGPRGAARRSGGPWPATAACCPARSWSGPAPTTAAAWPTSPAARPSTRPRWPRTPPPTAHT